MHKCPSVEKFLLGLLKISPSLLFHSRWLTESQGNEIARLKNVRPIKKLAGKFKTRIQVINQVPRRFYFSFLSSTNMRLRIMRILFIYLLSEKKVVDKFGRTPRRTKNGSNWMTNLNENSKSVNRQGLSNM